MKYRFAPIFIALLLTGCSKGGLLVGDAPDRFAKCYQFEGQAAAQAGVAPWANTDAMGSINSWGVTIFGEIPESVLNAIVAKCGGESG